MAGEPHHRDLLMLLSALEARVWDALANGDQQADDALLAENFLGVYPSGFADKSEHVQQLAAGPTVQNYRLSELKVLPLGATHAILSYRADFQRNPQVLADAMYVSSIWQCIGDSWVNVFSQDTPVEVNDER